MSEKPYDPTTRRLGDIYQKLVAEKQQRNNLVLICAHGKRVECRNLGHYSFLNVYRYMFCHECYEQFYKPMRGERANHDYIRQV